MPSDPVPSLLARASDLLEKQFSSLPPHVPQGASYQPEIMAAVLEQVAGRLADNYPYFHPLYAGQMLKPPHPVARAAYALAMAINPNNHARDGGR
ncbi:MAG TPA: aspartate aminotransferase family protein, partial [Terracidiphilus sp.]